MQTMMDENRFRQVLKEVLAEVIREQENTFRSLIAETVEDIALAHAVREGEETEIVGRDEVFGILEGRP